ncbi:MAG: AI-2E family transporter [Wolbachia endosymbiont of Tyrophagus putrescentiae]|nr:AI-2E family transporter [Wolbachia endosymbiont of Tyrophagus putrescentiae]
MVGILFLIRPVLFPCLTSVIAAYFLNPLVVKLEKYKVPRLLSVILIILILLTISILIITLVLPIVYTQATLILNFLISKIPSLQPKIIPPLLAFFNVKMNDNLLNDLSQHLTENYGDYAAYFIEALKIIANFMLQMLNSSFNLIHMMSLMVITIVTFFYVLRDLPIIMKKVNQLIPVSYRERVIDYFSKVDFIISNYLTGQMNVCFAMAIFYSIGLSILGVKHSITLGILSGILTFIPYIGALLYSTIGFLSAIVQFSEWFQSFAVLLLFLVGQLIDSNILVPLLIGKKVHIHPIIILLGVTVCAYYFGFIGILLFIPIIAVFKVSMELIAVKYCRSQFYKGK